MEEVRKARGTLNGKTFKMIIFIQQTALLSFKFITVINFAQLAFTPCSGAISAFFQHASCVRMGLSQLIVQIFYQALSGERNVHMSVQDLFEGE